MKRLKLLAMTLVVTTIMTSNVFAAQQPNSTLNSRELKKINQIKRNKMDNKEVLEYIYKNLPELSIKEKENLYKSLVELKSKNQTLLNNHRTVTKVDLDEISDIIRDKKISDEHDATVENYINNNNPNKNKDYNKFENNINYLITNFNNLKIDKSLAYEYINGYFHQIKDPNLKSKVEETLNPSVGTLKALASSSILSSYNPYDAVTYATTWSNNDQSNPVRNPEYPSYREDCTNFVSQCLKAGGVPNVGGTDIYSLNQWFFIITSGGTPTSNTWINASDFGTFWRNNSLSVTEEPLANISDRASFETLIYNSTYRGDALGLANSDGKVYHMMFVSDYDYSSGYGDILYCGHTRERNNASFFSKISGIMSNDGATDELVVFHM